MTTLPPPHDRDDLDDDEKAGVAYMLELIERQGGHPDFDR